MPASKVREFLDSQAIKYITVSHSTAYTAQEIAAATHIHGKELAKTVMVKLDGKMAMAVLPASHRIDFVLLKTGANATNAELAGETEFKSLFPDCETGAMPPFGNLYGLRVYVEQSLTRDQEIAFNAGSHSELIRMAYQDFDRLVHPVVVKFSPKS